MTPGSAVQSTQALAWGAKIRRNLEWSFLLIFILLLFFWLVKSPLFSKSSHSVIHSPFSHGEKPPVLFSRNSPVLCFWRRVPSQSAWTSMTTLPSTQLHSVHKRRLNTDNFTDPRPAPHVFTSESAEAEHLPRQWEKERVDEWRNWHWHIFTTTCKIDSWWEAGL